MGKYTINLRPENKKSLEKRYREDTEFAAALKKDVTKDLFASLEYSVRFQSNMISQTRGIPESGKSTINKIVCFHLIQFIKKSGKQPSMDLTFDYVDTIHRIAEYGSRRYDQGVEESDEIYIVFQDEQPGLSGPESRSYLQQLNNLINQMRKEQVFVPLVNPKFETLDTCNIYLEALGKDPETRTNIAMMYVDVDDKLKPSGVVKLQFTQEIEEYFDFYEKRKTENIVKLLKNRGMVTVSIPDYILNEKIDELLAAAEKRKVRTKEQVKRLANILGLGSTNLTKTVAEMAALQFEIEQEEEKEQQLEEQQRLQREREKREKEKIQKLVRQIAKDLTNEFDFVNESDAHGRLVKGYLVENYPENWQKLLKYSSQMLALAHYWQRSQMINSHGPKNDEELLLVTSDIELLRKAFERAVDERYHDNMLAQRVSYYFVFDSKDGQKRSDWSRRKAAEAMTIELGIDMNYPRYRKYLNDHNNDLKAIKENRKIWGDAGEYYLAYKIRQIVQKWKNQGVLKRDLPIDLSIAAEQKSAADTKTTDLFDVEITVGPDEKSVAAINCKYTHLTDQGFSMSPEKDHEIPWLFVIDKNTQQEFLVPSEKGKSFKTINRGDQSEVWTIESFLQEILDIDLEEEE